MFFGIVSFVSFLVDNDSFFGYALCRYGRAEL